MQRSYRLLSIILCGIAFALSARSLANASQDTQENTMDPQVAALWKSASQVYMKMKSYKHTAVIQYHLEPERKENEQENKYRPTSTFALQRPNKFRFTPSNHQMLLVSDGKDFYECRGLYYLKLPPIFDKVEFATYETPSDSEAHQLIIRLLQGKMLPNLQKESDSMYDLTRFKFGPKAMLNGKKCQTMVRHDNDSHSTSAEMIYFDVITHLLIGLTYESIYQDYKGGPLKYHKTELIKNIEINKPIPAATFKYTPPRGAKQVNDWPMAPGDRS